MERFTTIHVACAALALWWVGGCSVVYGPALPSVPPNLSPQEEYDWALANFEKAKKDYERARFFAGSPKFYGSGPWAAPVAVGVGLLGHLSISRTQAALLRATEQLEQAEDRLLTSQWKPDPPPAAAAPNPTTPATGPPSAAPVSTPATGSPSAAPVSVAAPDSALEPVFNHRCPYCGAGNTWQGRRDSVTCSSCKKEFRVQYAK